MTVDHDPLESIDLESSWGELERLLRAEGLRSIPVYCWIKTRMEWKKMEPVGNQFHVCRPGGEITNGIVTFGEKGTSSFYLTIYTFSDDLSKLTDALLRTRKIFWEDHSCCGVPSEHASWFKCILNTLGYRVTKDLATHYYELPKEKALLYDTRCPEDTYIAHLGQNDLAKIDSVWPHRFEKSLKYLTDVLRLNFGCGLYSKREDRLLSWVMKYEYGDIGVLQTDEEFKKKGYARLVTGALSRMLVERSNEVFAYVVVGNTASERLFLGMGFQYAGSYNFIDHEK